MEQSLGHEATRVASSTWAPGGPVMKGLGRGEPVSCERVLSNARFDGCPDISWAFNGTRV